MRPRRVPQALPTGIHTSAKLMALILAFAAGVTSLSTAWGEQESPAKPAPLQFRRVYALLERIKEWPRDAGRYVPMSAKDFERLVQSIPHGALEAPGQAVVKASYRARLVGDALVDGQATLDVVRPEPPQTMVPFAPCGLAVAEALWAGTPPKPASLGMQTDGQMALHTPESGQLLLKWALRGRREGSGVLGFFLELPLCPANTLSIDIPSDLIPVVEGAIVSRQDVPGQKSPQATAQWNIELGGRSRWGLRLVPSENLDPKRNRNTCRQSMVYRFSPQGLDLAVSLTLDVPKTPMKRVAMELDPGLKLTGAHCEDLPLKWQATAAPDGAPKSVVVFELPDSAEGRGRVLELTAIAPLALGRRVDLPGMRPREVFWQEGDILLVVPSTLSLEDFAPRQARQIKMVPLSAVEMGGSGETGEQIELQPFGPDATVSVLLTRPEASLQLDTGTAIELGGTEVTARMIAQFRIAGDERLELSADVAPQWTIDSVETASDGTDKKAEARGRLEWTQDKETKDQTKLRIRLDKPLSPQRPVRLSIVARCPQSPLGRSLGLDSLVPLLFRVPAGGKRLVAIHAAESFQLKFSGAERLTRFDPQDPDTAGLDLFAEPPQGVLFERDAASAPLLAILERRKPSYEATLWVKTFAAGNSLFDSFELRCKPNHAQVDRVVVQFSRDPSPGIQWSLEGKTWQPLSVTKGADSTLWEVNLPEPRSSEFTILARQTRPFGQSQPVCLVSLPEATSQRGTLLIGSGSAAPVRISNNKTGGLAPILPEGASSRRYSKIQAAFRYDPTRDVAVGNEGPVTLSPAATSDLRAVAWVWDCRLESRYQAEESSWHMATYGVENAGQESMVFRLPEPLTSDKIRGVWVDQAKAAWRSIGTDGGEKIDVPLPEGRRFPVVSIHFTLTDPRLSAISSLDAVLPEPEAATLRRGWTVWLPPGYQPSEPAASSGTWPSPRRTLSQRIFGPLGRGGERSFFDPFVPEDWNELAGYPTERNMARRNAARFLMWLGEREASLRNLASDVPAQKRENQPLRWSELLTQPAEGKVLMLVDRAALAEQGITPQSIVPELAASLSIEDPSGARLRGATLLRRAKLAILVQKDTVLLTTSLEAASSRGWLTSLEQEPAAWVLPGPLARRLAEASQSRNDSWLMSLETWKNGPAEPVAPWASMDLAGHGPADTPGWTASCLELSASSQTPLIVYRDDTLSALRWGVFLAVFALVWWQSWLRPSLLAILVGGLAVTAIVTSELAAGILAGAILGVLAQSVARWLWVKETAPDRSSSTLFHTPSAMVPAGSTRTAHTAAISGSALMLAAMAGFWSHAATGQEARRPQAPIAQVFIPIDEHENVVGDKYYVPESLFSALTRRETTLSDASQGWILEGAVYRGALAWQSSGQLELGDLRMSLDVQVFSPRARLQIPLGQLGVNLAPNGAMLEGRVIQPEWSEDDRALLIDVPEPGRHRLELTFRPASHSRNGTWSFEMPIPRLFQSRLELKLPQDAPSIEVPTALGSVEIDKATSRLIAQLGPADRLVVRWQEKTAQEAAIAAVDVEEYLWLKIQPEVDKDPVVLEVYLKCKFLPGQSRSLRMVADPSLQFIPGSSGATAAPAVRGVNRRQTLRFDLPPSESDQTVFQASFSLAGSSGVGRLCLPYFDPLDVNVTRRWLAVSVGRATYEIENDPQSKPIPIPAFLAACGGKEKPRAAYELKTSQPNWSIAVRPAASSTTVDQTLSLAFGQEYVQATLDASLTTTEGSNLTYRLAAPADLEVQELRVRKDDTERVARWSRVHDGSIVVFLKGPVSGKQALWLSGRLPVAGRDMPLPIVRLVTDQSKKLGIQVFREPSVRVQVNAKRRGLTAAPSIAAPSTAAQEPRPGQGRLVACYTVEGDAPTDAKVRIEPNRPKMTAQQIVRLVQKNGTWEGRIELAVRVNEGLVDELRLEVPPQWNGPYQIDQPATLRVIDPIGKARRQVVIRPPKAIDGRFALVVSSPMSIAPGDRLSVPRINVEQAVKTDCILVLPQVTQPQPAVWEMGGLRETRTPASVTTGEQSDTPSTAYQVIHEAYHAILQPTERAMATTRVLLADTHIAWQADGRCQGLACFDLDPAGLSEVPLELPTGLDLVQVTVAGRTAAAIPAGENRWQVPLGPDRLPQHIEVLFVGRLSRQEENSQRFFAPHLGKFPVQQALWTISTPPGYLIDETPPQNTELADRLGHDRTRLESVTTAMELGMGLPAEESEDLVPWYESWAVEAASLRAGITRQLAQSDQTDSTYAAQAELANLTRREKQVADRLNLTEGAAKKSSATATPGTLSDIWRRSLRRPRAVLRLTAHDATAIQLEYRKSDCDHGTERFWGAVTAGLLALVAALALAYSKVTMWLDRRGALVAVLVGTAWWLWLSPSILGLAVLIVALVVLARARWVRTKSKSLISMTSSTRLGPRFP